MPKLENSIYKAEFNLQIDLTSIDVDAVFSQLQMSTSFFRIFSYSGDDIITQCPFHGEGNEKHPSFGICNNRLNNNYGLYHCFACGATGTVLQLINYVHNKQLNSEYAISFVQSVSSLTYIDVRGVPTLRERTPLKLEAVSATELLSYQGEKSDYLTRRRIKPIIQRVFSCGFDPVDNSVTFPVRRIDGSVYFVVRRRIDYKWYNYPPGVDKPVYGFYEFSKIFPAAKSVVIVESIINALTLWGYQIPAIALLGTGSRTQIDFLNSVDIRQFVLCLDGDNAGYAGTEKLRKKLKARTVVVPMFPGYDVNDVDEETMKILYLLRS